MKVGRETFRMIYLARRTDNRWLILAKDRKTWAKLKIETQSDPGSEPDQT